MSQIILHSARGTFSSRINNGWSSPRHELDQAANHWYWDGRPLIMGGLDSTGTLSGAVETRLVTWCIAVWCTQNLRRDGSSFMRHQPCQRCKHTTSVAIQKTRHYTKLVTRVESHASAVSLLERAENSAVQKQSSSSSSRPRSLDHIVQYVIPC